jgi:tRNA-dihydrouridine synthase 3
MCEWLSFLHRYVPVGLIEVLPQKMNLRPHRYFGRNELETLMASDQVNDWIKLSEMVLGPASDSFSFIPKHKSSAISTEG